MTRTFSAFFLTEKAVPQTFSLLECMHVVEGVERSLVTHARHCDGKTSLKGVRNCTGDTGRPFKYIFGIAVRSVDLRQLGS